MNLEPDAPQDPTQALAEVAADVAIVGRLAEALSQSTDLFSPAVTAMLSAMGAALKADSDRLGRVVAPALRPPQLLVKDGEADDASNGPIIGEAPAAEVTT